MLVSHLWISNLTLIILVLCVVITAYYKWSFLYWRRKKVPYLEPSIPFGNCSESLTGKENLAITVKHIYNRMKQNGWKHGGIFVFTSPNYIPVHLNAIKNILTTDFHYFTDRAGYYNKRDPLSANLLNTGGPHWKSLRPKLTPCFTSRKIKMMLQNIEKNQNDLLEKIEEMKDKPLDIREICFCYTMDVIGSCALGLDLKSFQKDSLFKMHSQKFGKKSFFERLTIILACNFPNVATKLNIKLFPKDVTRFYIKTVKEIINLRKQYRNDFLQLLLDYNKNNSNDSLSVEEIAAQCFAFVVGGFETSTTAMAFALYELAKNPEIQNNLRSEMNAVLEKHDGKISFDSIKEMSYLSQVVDETLRMYPPLPLINRKCVKDYKIPDEDTVIKKGTIVVIPIMGVHYDEEYYPDPERFDPERFSDKNKNLRHKFSFLAFGGGPRVCIGMQFGLKQVKIALCCLIKNYKFSVNEKTPNKIRMQANNFSFLAVDGIWLNATKINKI